MTDPDPEDYAVLLGLADTEPGPAPQLRVKVCVNRRYGRQGCGNGGRGEKLRALLTEELARRGTPVQVETAICLGQCHLGPTIRIVGGQFFLQTTAEAIPAVAERIAAAAEAAAASPDQDM